MKRAGKENAIIEGEWLARLDKALNAKAKEVKPSTSEVKTPTVHLSAAVIKAVPSVAVVVEKEVEKEEQYFNRDLAEMQGLLGG